MKPISFFTPVYFGHHAKTLGHTILEKTDDFFFLGGRKAHVIPEFETINKSEGTFYKTHKASMLQTVCKIVAYATVIIPIIVLTVKVCLRYAYRFHEINTNKDLNINLENILKPSFRITTKGLDATFKRTILPLDYAFNLSVNDVAKNQIKLIPEKFDLAKGIAENTQIGYSNLKAYKQTYFEVRTYQSSPDNDMSFVVTPKDINKTRIKLSADTRYRLTPGLLASLAITWEGSDDSSSQIKDGIKRNGKSSLPQYKDEKLRFLCNEREGYISTYLPT